MQLERILCKIHSIEGLVVAIQIILDSYIDVTHDCMEEYNSVSSLIRLLRHKAVEVRHDIAKHI